MLTWETVIALRMERQCLTEPADKKEYALLYRDLSPGLNVHWHGFGQPPCLVYRTEFDDVAFNGRRQQKRTLVKGRFQNGNIGFIENSQMELFACLYKKPYRPVANSDFLLDLIRREGPMNIEVMKEMSGLLVKQITPALHRLQECFLIFEDQYNGEWDRGWYQFGELFPDVDLNRYTQNEALKLVLPRLFYRFVYLNPDNAASFYGLPKKVIKAAIEELTAEGTIVPWNDGYLLAEDRTLLDRVDGGCTSARKCRILALHRNDPLVRCEDYPKGPLQRLKEPCLENVTIPGSVKDKSEVTQYLLIDGEIRGAVMGHFRYGPYDLHGVRLSLSEDEAAARMEELLQAVYEVNGVREETLPIICVR